MVFACAALHHASGGETSLGQAVDLSGSPDSARSSPPKSEAGEPTVQGAGWPPLLTISQPPPHKFPNKSERKQRRLRRRELSRFVCRASSLRIECADSEEPHTESSADAVSSPPFSLLRPAATKPWRTSRRSRRLARAPTGSSTRPGTRSPTRSWRSKRSGWKRESKRYVNAFSRPSFVFARSLDGLAGRDLVPLSFSSQTQEKNEARLCSLPRPAGHPRSIRIIDQASRSWADPNAGQSSLEKFWRAGDAFPQTWGREETMLGRGQGRRSGTTAQPAVAKWNGVLS